MAIASYVRGATIIMDRRKFILVQEIEPDVWLIQDSSTGLGKPMPLAQMQKEYATGNLVFEIKTTTGTGAKAPASLVTVPEAHLQAAKIRRAYVLSIIQLPTTETLMKKAIKSTWEKLGKKGAIPHWITVARWKKKFLDGGKDINTLIDSPGQKGRWARYPEEVIEIVSDMINRHYLTRPPKNIQYVVDAAILEIKRENAHRTESMQLPKPTRRLVTRLIGKIPAFEKYAARHGRTAAVMRFRGVLNMHVTNAPLEEVEIDHTPLDMIVLDDKNLLPLGRPFLTVCIDAYSRCILGIYIGFEPPGFLSVSRCLRHAILPKMTLQEDFPEIDNPWLPHGVFAKLKVDNGQEFHSHALENACQSLNIQIEYSPRRAPWHKGKIERFLGTLNRAIAHGAPGSTFSNILEKGDYDPVKDAVVTLSTLRLVVHKWIADVYHQQPHSGLDHHSPINVWTSSIKQSEIQLADDPKKLDVILGTPAERRLSHRGISYEGITYNSNELVTLRRRHGEALKVDLRVDYGDLGHLYVLSPDNPNHCFKVPALNQSYAHGISLWMHKVFRKYAANHSMPNDPTGWLQAKMDIEDIIQRDLGRKKGRSSARVGRYQEASRKGIKARQLIPVDAVPEPAIRPASSSTSMPDLPQKHEIRMRPVYEPIIDQRQYPVPDFINEYKD